MTSSQNATALVLAGGRGTRISSVLPDVPKPMAPIARQPFLEWLTRRLAQQKIGNVVISTGYKADIIEKWAMQRSGLKPSCHREEKPLGTGGAIAECLPGITTPITVILNGDTLLLADLKPAFDKLSGGTCDGVIIARAVEDTSRYGSLDVADGMLRGFREKQPGRGLINGGIYIFPTAWLRDHMPQGVYSFETETLPRLLAEGTRIGVAETNAPFIDIGIPETLAAAETFIATHGSQFE